MENTSLTITLSGEALQISLEALVFPDRFRWSTSRHCNAEFELHVIVSGSCILEVEDQAHPLAVGSAVVIPPNRFHSASRVTETFERLSISLVADKESHVEKLLLDLSGLPAFRLTEAQLGLCRQLLQEMNTGNLFHAELSRACLTALLVGVLRMAQPNYAAADSPRKRDEYQPYNIIDRFFCAWPSPIGSEQELAQLLHISRRQLNRILQQYYGMTFREKFMRARMDYAAWLLRTTDKRASEIARLVNYSSEPSFFSSFKKYFGVTPVKYRQVYRDKRAQ